MRRMRWLLCGLAVIGMAPQARAADFSDTLLRGSQVFQVGQGPRWEGFYAGAHASYSMGSTDFGNGVSSLVSFALRNSVIQDQVSELDHPQQIRDDRDRLRRLRWLQLAMGPGGIRC